MKNKKIHKKYNNKKSKNLKIIQKFTENPKKFEISKMVKKLDNLKKSQKITFLQNILFSAKKKSSLFLNIRTTRFEQRSPVQRNPERKNLEKSQKILKSQFFFFFSLKIFFLLKRKKMLYS